MLQHTQMLLDLEVHTVSRRVGNWTTNQGNQGMCNKEESDLSYFAFYQKLHTEPKVHTESKQAVAPIKNTTTHMCDMSVSSFLLHS